MNKPSPQNIHIAATVFFHFSFKVKDGIGFYFLSVPFQKICSVFDRHLFKIVHLHGKVRSHVILVSIDISQMREVTFLQFCQSKSVWEVGLSQMQKMIRVKELDVSSSHCYDSFSIHDHIGFKGCIF